LFSSSVERTTMTVVPRLRSVALPEDEEVSGEAASGGELAASAPRDECGGSAEEEEEEEWGEESRKELDLVSTVESGRGTLAISADQRRHVFFSPSSIAPSPPSAPPPPVAGGTEAAESAPSSAAAGVSALAERRFLRPESPPGLSSPVRRVSLAAEERGVELMCCW
jgi:hypothetical protein